MLSYISGPDPIKSFMEGLGKLQLQKPDFARLNIIFKVVKFAFKSFMLGNRTFAGVLYSNCSNI